MTIKTKVIINLVVFVILALILGYREMVMMHPDSIPFLNIKVQV